MSVLNVKQIESCFGLCNHGGPGSSSNPESAVSRRVVPNDHQIAPEQKEVDALLCQAMDKLTLEEQKKQQDILHGVDEFVEDPVLVESALKDLDLHISSTKQKSMYEVAERIKPDYVHARAFRVMFLRANEYDAQESADQMLRFFDLKYRLFGIEKLVEDITFADLSEEDVACLKTGHIQLAGRDQSGRHIIAQFAGVKGSLESWLRAHYFIKMRLMEDEENQLRGNVLIWYGIGDYKFENGTMNRRECIDGAIAARCIPQKKQAIHMCLDEMRQYVMCSMLINVIQGKTRARLRIHFGSQMEIQYQLSSYGIPLQAMPLDSKGMIDIQRNLQWIQSCTIVEDQLYQALKPEPSVQGKNGNVAPGPNDVLFTGGKVNNHLGNQRFHSLIQKFAQEYHNGRDATKREISSTIIEKTHESGARFLQQQQQQQQQKSAAIVWKEVPVEELRRKIMQAFRNRRRMAEASKRKTDNATSGTLIAGEPLLNDVIFGRAQRNPGSKLLQRLIKENFEEYESLGRGVKIQLVETIMQTIKDQGGRFLCKSTGIGNNNGGEGDRWLEVSHNNARERISKYFRNYRRPAKK